MIDIIVPLALIALHVEMIVGGAMLSQTVDEALDVMRDNWKASGQKTNPFRKEL